MDNAEGINSLMKDSENIEPYCLYSAGVKGRRRPARHRALSKVVLLTKPFAINLSSFKQSFLIFLFLSCVFFGGGNVMIHHHD